MRIEKYTSEAIDAAVAHVDNYPTTKGLGIEKLVACEQLRVLAYRTIVNMPNPASEAELLWIILGTLITGVEIGLVLEENRVADAK